MEAATFAIEAPNLMIAASETAWRGSGLVVTAGERFAVSARGAIWLSKLLGVVMEPKSTRWVRVAGAPEIAKPADNDHVFTAWADEEVELFIKGLSEWASPDGDLISTQRAKTTGALRVRVARTDAAATASAAPDGWRYL